jgi:Asp-tRNA(Asn)/Glu-tRNA(Gln) amidotransferase A subunit family amidase
MTDFLALRDRRAFLGYFSSIGLGSTLLPGVLWAKVAEGAEIDAQTIAAAEEIAGLQFDEAERAMMVNDLKQQREQIDQLHAVKLDNAVPPAVQFSPLLPGMKLDRTKKPIVRSRVRVGAVPKDLEELAFHPVTELSELVRTRRVSSTALTEMYLARLKKYDPVLKCVVTLTEDRALAQAKAADAEIARGRYRGPLHGIPWGAKDLLAVKGYPTTWGTPPFREQRLDYDATVVKRLDAAGAVLVAKLTLGELAMGDVWFGGTTKNPWKLDQGSSGSSAGPASATAAGLVGFSIGSETLGSISSPSTRCGVTGLRPTYGRVPKTGAMALSWSMDKLGPICRSVEDCALVLTAIYGPDGDDLTVHDASFNWNGTRSLSAIRVGFFKSVFDLPENDVNNRPQHPTKKFDDAALAVFDRLGIELIPVDVPSGAYNAMRLVLDAECAASFDELTRSGRDAEMSRQTPDAWPNAFRAARFIPATDYVNANRARTLAMEAWRKLFSEVDVIVTPTSGSSQLVATNLTGHPAVILPNGFRENGTPVSLTFLGRLFDEATLCRVAMAYQNATDFHLAHPKITV